MNVSTVFDAYNKLHIISAACDQCNKTLEQNDIVLHCEPNPKHVEGYDLCTDCGEKEFLKDQQRIFAQVCV